VQKLGAVLKLEENQEAVPYTKNPTFIRLGSTAANVTVLQAAWRQLKDGEKRIPLIRKCVRALTPEFRGPLFITSPCIAQADVARYLVLLFSAFGKYCVCKTAKQFCWTPSRSVFR